MNQPEEKKRESSPPPFLGPAVPQRDSEGALSDSLPEPLAPFFAGGSFMWEMEPEDPSAAEAETRPAGAEDGGLNADDLPWMHEAGDTAEREREAPDLDGLDLPELQRGGPEEPNYLGGVPEVNLDDEAPAGSPAPASDGWAEPDTLQDPEPAGPAEAAEQSDQWAEPEGFGLQHPELAEAADAAAPAESAAAAYDEEDVVPIEDLLERAPEPALAAGPMEEPRAEEAAAAAEPDRTPQADEPSGSAAEQDRSYGEQAAEYQPQAAPDREIQPEPATAWAPRGQPTGAVHVEQAGGFVDGGSEVLSEVADRLEQIARSLRGRSPADLLAGSTDPFELLVVGYVLAEMRRGRSGLDSTPQI